MLFYSSAKINEISAEAALIAFGGVAMPADCCCMCCCCGTGGLTRAL